MNNLMLKAINKFCRVFLRGFQVTPVAYCPSWRKLNVYEDPTFVKLSSNENVSANSLLKTDRLYSIYQALNWLSKVRKHPFHSMEVGVYKGGGSFFIAQCLDNLSTNYSGHFSVDTFEGHKLDDLPNKKEGGHSVSMFSDTNFENVKKLLSSFDTSTVVASRIQDAKIDYSSLGFVHLDTDLYGPTKYVIEKMMSEAKSPYVILVDDYGFKTCPGVKQAVDECLSASKPGVFSAPQATGQFIIVATATQDEN